MSGEKNINELVNKEESSKTSDVASSDANQPEANADVNLANIEEMFNKLKEENELLKSQLTMISKRYNRLFMVYDALLEKYITVDENKQN